MKVPGTNGLTVVILSYSSVAKKGKINYVPLSYSFKLSTRTLKNAGWKKSTVKSRGKLRNQT